MGARRLYEEKIQELIKRVPEEKLSEVISLIEKINLDKQERTLKPLNYVGECLKTFCHRQKNL